MQSHTGKSPKRVFKRITGSLAKSAIAGMLLFGTKAHAENTSHTRYAELAKPPTVAEKQFNYGGWCAGYARRVAETMFGEHYTQAPSWFFGKENKVVAQAPFQRANASGAFSKTQVLSLIQKGVLKPGHILGCYNPRSGHAAQYDVTHTVLYVGNDARGTPIFWHNFAKSGEFGVKRDTLDSLYHDVNGKQRLYIVQVIAPKSS